MPAPGGLFVDAHDNDLSEREEREHDQGDAAEDERGAPESAPRRSDQTIHECRHGPERPLLTLGWSMLALGLIGGLLPVIQGWPFGVAGAVILYVESRWFQRKLRRWRQHHPRVERVWLRLRAWRHGRKKPRPGATRPVPPPDEPSE